MTPSNYLFELIKSLSKNERRFFKLYSSFHVGDKNYLKLFDVISMQEKYDEKNVKEEFRQDKKFLRSFPRWKQYLYQMILKSLRNYHAENTANIALSNAIIETEILFDKGLYKHTSKLLAKAKHLALAHEKFPFYLTLSEYDREQMVHSLSPKLHSRLLAESYTKAKRAIKKYEHNIGYYELSSQLFGLFRQHGYIRDANFQSASKAIMKNPMLKDERKAETYAAKNIYYRMHALYGSMTGYWEENLHYYQKQVSLIESHPVMIRDNARAYVNALGNLCNVSDLLNKKNIFREALHKMRNIRTSSPGLKNFVFRQSYILELESYCTWGNFEKALKLVPEITKAIDSGGIKLEKFHIQNLHYCIAYSYFGAGNYKESLKWLNKVANDQDDTDVRLDTHVMTRMFGLILHYELGNEQYLEYDVKSTERFLKKKNQYYNLETILIRSIGKIFTKAKNTAERKIIFMELKKELLKLAKDPVNKAAFDAWDFLSWVESKIQNRRFAYIVRDKARARIKKR